MNVRKLLVGLIMFGSVAFMAALAAGTASGPTPADAKPASFKVITWHALVPKEWDPFKRYRDANLGMLIDSDPKVLQMMRDMRAAWDNAPTVAAMDGATVRLPGYLVPLEETKGGLKEFLLVPYFGACIHTPPPPANQIVHVVTTKAVKGFRMMDTVWVSGTLSIRRRQDSMMGMSGYRMDAMVVERYVPPRR